MDQTSQFESFLKLWEKYMQSGTSACKQGHYADAEKSFSLAAKEAEKFGPMAKSLLSVSLGNLGDLYKTQGKYGEAEELFKRTLAMDEQESSPNDPFLVGSLNNLAEVCKIQGKYAEAESFYKRCLAMHYEDVDAKKYGNQGAEIKRLLQEDVARCLESYAELLRKTNRATEAAQLATRAKAMRAGK